MQVFANIVSGLKLDHTAAPIVLLVMATAVLVLAFTAMGRDSHGTSAEVAELKRRRRPLKR